MLNKPSSRVRRRILMAVRFVIDQGVRVNRYAVLVDEQEWCWTTSDDEGLKLSIAVVKLEARKLVKSLKD